MSCPSSTLSFVIIIAIVLHCQAPNSFAKPHAAPQERKFVSKTDTVDYQTSAMNKGSQPTIEASKTNGDRGHWTSISEVLLKAVNLHTNNKLGSTPQISNGSLRPTKLMDTSHSKEATSHREDQEHVPKYGKLLHNGLDHNLEPSKHSLPILDSSLPEIHRIRHNSMSGKMFRYLHLVTVNSNEQKNTKSERKFKLT
ncbi:unnamed protein product [Orchesella dallaii]|uniref:Uncharacterized protein n=1 Tax=Orchesella dallaii TaxID=48710 RepID=A0ABP1RGF8_9HEXA